MEKAEWKVSGMTCSNCALAISKYLTKQGFVSVKVNPLGGEVSFESTAIIEEEKIKKGIEKLGYTISGENIPEVTSKVFLKTPLQKFWFCLPFTLALMLPMFLHIGFLMKPLLQLLLCLPVFITGTLYFGKRAYKSLKSGLPDMNVLITLGAAAAFTYSLILTIQNPANESLYYESAATIITLVFLGYWLEDVSLSSTQKALNSLSGEQKIMANMIAFDDEYNEHIFPIENSQLKPGDLILIKTGEHVPADAKILSGDCTVNESIITGESLPVEKKSKDSLIGGSIIETGTVKAQVTATGKDSVLSGIIQLAKQAQTDKPLVQLFADKISAIFVPAVLLIALVTFFLNHYYFHIAFDKSLMRSIAVLVIACPCAMGLATPAAIAVGLGRAAKKGILFKDAKSLELFKGIKHIVFDKTGTLTTGKFYVADMGVQNISRKEFKNICYSLEKFSTHPIAKSIANEFKTKEILKLKNVQEVKNLGIKAIDSDGNTYVIGSYKILQNHITEKKHNIYLLKNNELIGWIDVRDEIRPEARQVINYFNKKDIKTYLLSGDNKYKCFALGEELGISQIYAEQTPEQKLDVISNLTKLAPTAMIGDGINDAPALAKATIGITISEASHIARHNSRVILMNSGLKNLPLALGLGHHTFITIKQNLFWAFIYNIIAIPVAAFGLLTPGFAALVMGFSDVVLAANSLRLTWKKVD